MSAHRLYSIVIVALIIDGCLLSQHPFGGGYSLDQQFEAVPAYHDSIPVYPSTKYFYRYNFYNRDWKITPEWALGNLTHLGIEVAEAWYYPGSSHTNLGNGAIGKTIVPPVFIVGLAKDNPEILEHHYEQMNRFDPLMQPNGPGSRLNHYVSRRNK